MYEIAKEYTIKNKFTTIFLTDNDIPLRSVEVGAAPQRLTAC